MRYGEDQRLPLRQFRVTIVETPENRRLGVTLSWRTFPCAATVWDGHATAWVAPPGDMPLDSQDALRAVLEVLAGEPWKVGVVH